MSETLDSTEWEESATQEFRPALLGDTLSESVVSSFKPIERAPVSRESEDSGLVVSRMSLVITVPGGCTAREAARTPQGSTMGHVGNPCWDYVLEVVVDPARRGSGCPCSHRKKRIYLADG